MPRPDTSIIIRFVFIAALWIVLAVLVVLTHPLNLWTLFILAASGIVVFVPLYKKYIGNGRNLRE